MEQIKSCETCYYMNYIGYPCTDCRDCESINHDSNKEYLRHWKQKTDKKVDHPSHYNREGAMECIDEMILLFGIEETMIFCKLNAWKYRYRAGDKGDIHTDKAKSDNYLKLYKEMKGREE